MTLALLNLDFPIIFSIIKGNKLNKAAIEALSLKLDMESTLINEFNEVLTDRCKASGCYLSVVEVIDITTQKGQ